MTETWLPVVGDPRYEVSDLGRVRRAVDGVNTYAGRLLGQRPNVGGYSQVILSMGNRKSVSVPVHRLVANAFHAKPSPEMEVNHIDGIKTNNAASNLEWTTRLGNMQHAARMGLRPHGPGHLYGWAKIHKPKTHCPSGHPYDETNTKWYQGRRYCRACHYEHSRRYWLKKRGVAA